MTSHFTSRPHSRNRRSNGYSPAENAGDHLENTPATVRVYRHAETVQKNYTVRQAVEFARALVNSRSIRLNVTSLVGVDLDRRITLAELNDIQADLVAASYEYLPQQ